MKKIKLALIISCLAAAYSIPASAHDTTKNEFDFKKVFQKIDTFWQSFWEILKTNETQTMKEFLDSNQGHFFLASSSFYVFQTVCSHGNVEMTKLLLEYGLKSYTLQSDIFDAIKSQKFEIANFLINRDGPTKAIDITLALLDQAAASGEPDVIRDLKKLELLENIDNDKIEAFYNKALSNFKAPVFYCTRNPKPQECN